MSPAAGKVGLGSMAPSRGPEASQCRSDGSVNTFIRVHEGISSGNPCKCFRGDPAEGKSLSSIFLGATGSCVQMGDFSVDKEETSYQ